MADYSLDERIRSRNIPQMDMSLDEYIHMNNIGKPKQGYSSNHDSNSAPSQSKFDRYRNQDGSDSEMDEGGTERSEEMPKLVPYVPKTLPPKKPIHNRLGDRGSVCESIHTSRLNVASKPQLKSKNRGSIQNRLGRAWVNPAIVERNRIAIHALNEYKRDSNNRLNSNTNNSDDGGNTLLNAFARAIQRESAPEMTSEQKYNMQIQKEISSLQGNKLYYACPGKFVISSDGPGVRGNFKVPTHSTDVSLNQRFA